MEIQIETLLSKSNPNKVIVKIPKKSTINLPKTSPLFEYDLFKKETITKNNRYFLFYEDKCIFFQDKSLANIKGICFYDFDLRVELLYHSMKNNAKLSDLIYGLKFIRKNDSMEIQSQNKENLQSLIPYFSKRLNLANFHSHYKAIKKIGKGNFASVYLVESFQTGVSYAVKAFSKELVFEEEKGKKSLINEIKIMRELNHINIIKLEEVHETDNSIYMILELLQGGNLVDYLKSHGKFSEKEAAIFMRAILRGISHMHSHNIMHRDLKPENILFRNSEINEDNICIVDFGLSTFVDVEEYLFVRCGTPGFVAPEVINLKDLTKKYDKICDIFSIGIILHILLFGRSIFPGKTYNDILAQNRACSFNFNDPIYKKVTSSAKDFLMKLLEVNPEKRISAEMALNHHFLVGGNKKQSTINPTPQDFSEEICNIEAEEGHALKLITSYEYKSFDSKSFSPMKGESPPPNNGENSPFSPLRKYDNLSIYSPLKISKENKEIDDLYSRHPILNGYTNTVENLGSPTLPKFDKLLSARKNLEEMQSPQLKRDLEEREIKTFKIRLSTFNINKQEEPEEKKFEDEVISSKKK